MKWNEVISIKDFDGFESVTDEQHALAAVELERYLDFIEGTEEGQFLFEGIKAKYPQTGCVITIHNNYKDDFQMKRNGELLWYANSDQPFRFYDEKNGVVVTMTNFRSLYHELVHASDPRIIPAYDKRRFLSAYGQKLTEEYADQSTDRFIQRYRPFGEDTIKACYDNAFSTVYARASCYQFHQERISRLEDRHHIPADKLEKYDKRTERMLRLLKPGVAPLLAFEETTPDNLGFEARLDGHDRVFHQPGYELPNPEVTLMDDVRREELAEKWAQEKEPEASSLHPQVSINSRGSHP